MRPPPTYRRGYTPTLGWASLAVLLLLVELGHAQLHCINLKHDADRTELLSCHGNPMKLEPIINENGTNYPDVDISAFTEDDYFNFVLEKDDAGSQPEKLRKFVGNLVCSGSSLTSITKLGFQILNENISQSLRLENNLKLTTVEFSTKLYSNRTIKFTVANNRLLSPESIKHLKELNYTSEDSYIQEFGECVIESGAQKSFKDLENCYYLKGNLVIDKDTDTKSKFPSSLTDIQGCISIKSTNLTNLHFLETIQKSNCSGKHEITNNKNLCIFPEEYSNMIQKFKDMNNKIKIEKNSGCKGECTWKYLHEKKDKKCLIITETVTISNTKESEDLGYLSQVEEIHGRLIIQYTELYSIDMFPKLHTVSITGKNTAIYIARNTKLTSFEFPALKNITSVDPSVNVFVMTNNNPNFTVEDEQYEHFRNLTDGRLKLPQKQPPPQIIVLQNQTDDSVNEETERKSVRKLSKDEKVDLGLIIGLTLTILFVVILAVVAGILLRRYCNKLKKKREEQRKKQENDALEQEFARRVTVSAESKSNTVDNFLSSRDTIKSPNEKSEKSTCEKNVVKKGRSRPADHFYIAQVGKEFEEQMNNYNLECSRITEGLSFLTILRDKFDGAKCDLETMEPAEDFRVWTHNLNLSMHQSRPRKEFPTKESYQEVVYDAAQFDPQAFIDACMKHSCIHISGRTMIAALDYCLKNGSYANPLKDKEKGNCLLINVPGPIHMVGDTHGSLIDLQAILSLDPMNVYEEKGIHPMMYYRYLFTGDYLDRGIYDSICFTFLMVCGCLHGNRMFFLRGNHEWMAGDDFHEHIHSSWPLFEADLIIEKIYRVSQMLPIAAIVNNKIFATHGGITRDFLDALAEQFCMELDQFFKKLPYPLDYPLKLDDKTHKTVEWFLWSDPSTITHDNNVPRGGGGVFNEDDVHSFLKTFDLDVLVRAHETFGFMSTFGGKLISIFGNFHSAVSSIGFPYVINDVESMNALKSDSNNSLGVLRLNADGTLEVMMLRQTFLAGEAVFDGPSTQHLKYADPVQKHFKTCPRLWYLSDEDRRELTGEKEPEKAEKSKAAAPSAQQTSQKTLKAGEVPGAKADAAPKSTQKETPDAKGTVPKLKDDVKEAKPNEAAKAPTTEAPKSVAPKIQPPNAQGTAPKLKDDVKEAKPNEAAKAPKSEAPKSVAPKIQPPNAQGTAPKLKEGAKEAKSKEAAKAPKSEAPKEAPVKQSKSSLNQSKSSQQEASNPPKE